MGYRRRIHIGGYYSNRQYRDENHRTPVTFSWNQMLGAYELKFHDTKQWDALDGMVRFINATIPYGERDYDKETKTHFIDPKHFQVISIALKNCKYFNVSIIEKPEGQVSTATFVPADKDMEIIEQISGFAIKGLGYDDAKKQYRKAMLKMHPDRHPEDPDAGRKASSINESWHRLELNHYKVKKELVNV